MEGILEPLKNQSEPWKSPGNLFLKKDTNPVYYLVIVTCEYANRTMLFLRDWFSFSE